MLDNGLRDRFPDECADWLKRTEAARKAREDNTKSEERRVMDKLDDELPQTERTLLQTMRHKTSDVFPLVLPFTIVVVSSVGLQGHLITILWALSIHQTRDPNRWSQMLVSAHVFLILDPC